MRRWRHTASLSLYAARHRVFLARQIGQIGAGNFHFRQNFLRPFVQLLPGVREFYASTEAVEQPAVEFLLKRFNGVADRRLRDEKLARGQRKTADSCQRRKREQLSAVYDGCHGG